MKFDLQSAQIAQQQEFNRQQSVKKVQTIQRLEAYLATPADADSPDDASKRTQAEIRLIGLRMAGYQAKLREQIRAALQHKLDETNAVDYTAHRAHRKNHRRHLSSKQKKLQREHREALMSQKDTKTSRFHDDLVSFSKSFKKEHSEHLIRQRKVLRSMTTFHTQREREERKRAGEAEKQRIRALKENDEEAYMKLLEDTKNDRLLTLVRETDSALYSLGAKIRAHKTETMSASAAASLDAAVKRGEDHDATAEPKDVDNSRVHPDLLKTKQAYYEVSHTVKEVVKEQPLSLAGGKLKEYQIKGLEWLVSLYNNGLNGILADEMGLGKTIQAIAVLCHVMEKQNNTGPFLVVVPNSTLPNWANEFEQWAPHMERVIYKGSKAGRKSMREGRLAAQTFNVLVTTYEYVMSDKSFLSKIKWKYIIVDEGHRIKNHKSKLSRILGGEYTATNRLLLTGTPLHNNLPELWSLLNFLLPDIFSSMKDFESWFNAPFENTGQKAEMTEEEELLIINRLHQVLRPFLLRRLKSEVMLELPQKTEKVIKCDISGWQAHMYRRILEGKGIFSNNVNGSGRSGIQLMNNDLMQLRKICNHPHIFYDVEEVDESIVTASGKVHMLDRILPKLKHAGHRVLIFSQMTQLMDILEDYFELRKFKYLRLDGSTTVDDRAEKMRLFQEPGSEYFVFLLSTRAGGMGINLQTADTVVIFDSDWNPQMDKQAQDRAHRIGQQTEVRVLRLVCAGTVEVAILNQARAKDDVDKKVIQAGKFNQKSTDTERRKELESLVTSGGGKLVQDDEGPPDEEQLIEMLARDEKEIVLYESLSREIKVPPLGSEPDIPGWVQQGESAEDRKIDEAEEAEENGKTGRGAREKKAVKYTYSDADFDKLLASSSSEGEDSDSGTDGAARPAKRARASPSAPTTSGQVSRGRGRPRGSGRPRGRPRGSGRGRGRGRGRAIQPAATAAQQADQSGHEAPIENPQDASMAINTQAIDDISCMTCGRADSDESMVLCDGCENARHTFCCTPPLPGVPEDDWFCGVCAASPPDFR